MVLFLVSRLSLQLPHAVKSSGGYFRDLSVVLVSPRFVFIVGNAIVIILFAKSGQFSARDSDKNGFFGADDLYEEFVKNSDKNHKQICRDIVEYKVKQRTACTENSSRALVQAKHGKNYARSNSENIEHQKIKPHRQLRRSETEKLGENMIKYSGEGSAKSWHPEDAMSNEEFRDKVEAFIARQQRFRLEEEEYSDAV